MMFRGTIENGRLVLEDGGVLPDGTLVSVTVRTSSKKKAAKVDSLAGLGRLAVSTGVRDLADQHDHYAYGTPKRNVKTTKRARPTRARRGRTS